MLSPAYVWTMRNGYYSSCNNRIYDERGCFLYSNLNFKSRLCTVQCAQLVPIRTFAVCLSKTNLFVSLSSLSFRSVYLPQIVIVIFFFHCVFENKISLVTSNQLFWQILLIICRLQSCKKSISQIESRQKWTLGCSCKIQGGQVIWHKAQTWCTLFCNLTSCKCMFVYNA